MGYERELGSSWSTIAGKSESVGACAVGSNLEKPAGAAENPELVLVPFSKTLCSDQGVQPIVWTDMPSWNDRRGKTPRRCGEVTHDPFAYEISCSGVVQAPNRNVEARNMESMTLEKLREILEQQLPEEIRYNFNWDVEEMWFYIFYTPEQATLVRAVNHFAASIPYVQAVGGTPLGDENAAITVRQRLHFFSEGDPRVEGQ